MSSQIKLAINHIDVIKNSCKCAFIATICVPPYFDKFSNKPFCCFSRDGAHDMLEACPRPQLYDDRCQYLSSEHQKRLAGIMRKFNQWTSVTSFLHDSVTLKMFINHRCWYFQWGKPLRDSRKVSQPWRQKECASLWSRCWVSDECNDFPFTFIKLFNVIILPINFFYHVIETCLWSLNWWWYIWLL